MQIFVKSLTGSIITLEVSGTDTIANVKRKITDKEGIPVEKQRLVHNDKQLEDDKTLDACGIKRENTIYIVLKNVVHPVQPGEGQDRGAWLVIGLPFSCEGPTAGTSLVLTAVVIQPSMG